MCFLEAQKQLKASFSDHTDYNGELKHDKVYSSRIRDAKTGYAQKLALTVQSSYVDKVQQRFLRSFLNFCQWVSGVYAGTTGAVNEVQLIIDHHVLVPFR